MYIGLETLRMNVPGTWQEHIELAAANGFQALTIPEEILEDKKLAYEATAMLKDKGLKWGAMPLPTDTFRDNVDDKQFDEELETLARWADVAGRIGCTFSFHHIFPGSDFRAYDENFEWHVIRLRKVLKICNDNGIYMGLECVGPKTMRDKFQYPFIHTIPGILALIQATGQRAGLVFDVFHWYCNGARQDELTWACHNLDKLTVLHVSDAVASRTMEEQIDMERALPQTTGCIDTVKILKELDKYGYTGCVYTEPQRPFKTSLSNMTPAEAIKLIGDALKRVVPLKD